MPIYNYGLDWDYNKGPWGQRGRSKPVCFSSQIGIYVLYKNKKLIYVGRSGSGKKPGIGGRLYYHHGEGQLAGRWNRFSWFGFVPVESGEVRIDTPSTLSNREDEIRDVEALLIYLLMPPGNGNGGSYKHIEKYQQVSSPEDGV